MSITSELQRFGKAFWANMKGREPNLIPLSGLTLESHDRQLAQALLQQKTSQWSEEWITTFESSLAHYTQLPSCLTYSEGRVALSAILQSLDLQENDQVLVCGFTCIAVANSVVFLGAEPIYYDIELNSYGPLLEDVQQKFKQHKKIKGIIVQHSFGMIGDQVPQLISWARSVGIWVIEDAAHALGATKNGTQAGQFGDAAFFSFERSKCISTFQGGAAGSINNEINEKLRELQSVTPKPGELKTRKRLRQFIFTYDTQRDNRRWYKKIPATLAAKDDYIPGNQSEELLQVQPNEYMQRLAEPLARLGIRQVKELDHYNQIRQAKAEEWSFWADSKGIQRPKISKGDMPVFLRYPVLMTKKHKNNLIKKDMSWASDLGIEAGIWYKSHLHPTSIPVKNCPNAAIAVARCVNLPTNLAYKP